MRRSSAWMKPRRAAVGGVDARGRARLDRLLGVQRRRAVATSMTHATAAIAREADAGHDQPEEHEDDAAAAPPSLRRLRRWRSRTRHQEPRKGRSGFVAAAPDTLLRAARARHLRRSSALARDALGAAAPASPRDRRRMPVSVDLGDARRPAPRRAPRTAASARARRRRAPARPRRRAPPSGERIVSLRRIPAARRSLGITIRASEPRAQERVVQPHVLDGAVLALEGHPVADAQRLRDREHDPGDELASVWRRRSRRSRRRSRPRRAGWRRAGRGRELRQRASRRR